MEVKSIHDIVVNLSNDVRLFEKQNPRYRINSIDLVSGVVDVTYEPIVTLENIKVEFVARKK